MEDIKAVVLDIEGTVISISFVKDTLFPHARKNLRNYLRDHWNEPELVKVIDDLRTLAEEDAKDSQWEGVPRIPPTNHGDGCCPDALQKTVEENVLWQMDRDCKTAPLKTLQGLIWLQGYRDSELVAPLYDDVLPALERWKADGKSLYIYSSGSVQAQKLLFSHTASGNVCHLLDGYFDITTAGSKVRSTSYVKIAESVGLLPNEVLFLTDIPAEARAAAEAGMQTRLVVRPGNAPLTEDDRIAFGCVTSFTELRS